MVSTNKPLEVIKKKICHFIIFITEYWHFANLMYELKNILMKLMGKIGFLIYNEYYLVKDSIIRYDSIEIKLLLASNSGKYCAYVQMFQYFFSDLK